ncbi:MAG: hypothetical protein KDE47_11360 [Caldilineaceae bacterium]|nr:hypothetical protein [Caldilineaceae bacterium]
MKAFALSTFLLVLLVAPELPVQDVVHHAYFPAVKVSPINPRKGVALAYGWVANPDGARILGVGTKLRWWIQEGDDLTTLQTMWCDELDGESLYPLLAKLQSEEISQGIVRLNGKPLVLLGNEPDIKSQCNKTPAEFANIYQMAIQHCPDCVFTFPSVSSWDMFCDWPQHERQAWAANVGGGWCWSREFLAELDRRGMVASFPVCAFRHYYTIGWHVPQREVEALAPAEALAALVGCSQFVVAEYGTCNADLMAEMTKAYNGDSRVLAFYAWTPNLPPPPNGVSFPQCEIFFDWQTGALTEIGRAFAGAGR